MITRQFSINQTPLYPFEQQYDINRIAFFDIETTGFAADTTYLYLIGCAYYQDSSFYLVQWFSEGIKDEPLLLHAFFDFIKTHDILIHYNGNGFDIPYLQRKCEALHLEYSFDNITSIDLYKRILPYKKIFGLKSFKLKSIENFLNISRKDTFDGGDLIQVYSSFLGKRNFENLWRKRNPELSLSVPTESEEMLNQLLLHNEDDIKGLINISTIIYYTDLFEKPIHVYQARVEGDILKIHYEISGTLPVPITFGTDLAHLAANQNKAVLQVRIYEGELKHFYEDYKDYYYLPAEDYAIHKSLATYVDKDYRVKAKPATCYTRKEGIFVPQYEYLITPYFKFKHQDKLSFLEVHTDFLLQEENLELYVKGMMGWMLNK